jgi:hypothetical protein
MVLNEKTVIHLVDMIPGENQHGLRLVTLDEVMVLANAVGCPSIPVKAHALLRRDDFKKMTDLRTEDIPPFFEMVIQRLGLVLGEHDDLVYLGVDTVAQGEIDEAVDSPKWDRRLASVLSQRHKPFTPSAGHDKSERVSHDISTKKKVEPCLKNSIYNIATQS